MRVVLDTNILFSALISPHGAPDAIYRAWRAARFEVVTSRMQLDEIRRASRYPKLQAILQPAKVGAIGYGQPKGLGHPRGHQGKQANEQYGQGRG